MFCVINRSIRNLSISVFNAQRRYCVLRIVNDGWVDIRGGGGGGEDEH